MTWKNVKDRLVLSVDDDDRAMKIARDTLTMTIDKKGTSKKVIIDFEMRLDVEKEKIQVREEAEAQNGAKEDFRQNMMIAPVQVIVATVALQMTDRKEEQMTENLKMWMT